MTLEQSEHGFHVIIGAAGRWYDYVRWTPVRALDLPEQEQSLKESIEPTQLSGDDEPFDEEQYIQLKRIAEQGGTKAMMALFWSIRGPERLRWLCRAADHGYADAQYRVGFLYKHGKTGAPQDLMRAYLWYRLAAQNGHIWADSEAEEAVTRMTSEQLALAKTLIAKWKPGQCKK